jgi:hypothetical protein
MASRIKLKRSLTPNSVPTTSDLTDKEVGININDRTLFVNNNGNIVEVLNADPNDEKIVPSMLSGAITDGVGKTWYVSTNGTDQATLGSVNPRHGETTGANVWGKTPTTSFASLKYALDNYVQEGDTVVVAAGTFTETFPLTVPVGVTITGDSSKSTFIKPTVGTNQLDAFLIEGNCTIQDICVKEFFYNTSNDTGYGFRLKSTYVVSADGRRPYIQRCSVITQGSSVSGSDPRGYAAGDAGRGALVDGSSVGASSAEAALLFNECTFVVPNAVGLYLKNGARCEWLNSFTYFAADSIKGENPGGSGFAGQGRTRLKLSSVVGTFNAADTITYYDTDGTTVLASGTIDENDGTYLYIDGQGSGTFEEGEFAAQDIRSSSGGTAQYITLADYTDFGAELRSIGSASVYGERGISAIGKGVRLRCIVHNFGYVGVGADQSNDISNVNQANEIIETGGGRALFTSMDQNGDFRVGNAFFIDQVNDRVGVGTTPSYKFHVERGSAGDYAYMGGSSDNSRGLKFSSADDGIYLGAAHTIQIMSAGGSLLFKDDDTNWLKLNQNGNVGVNNTNPQSQLAVNGYITESTDSGTTYWNVVTQQDIGTDANQVPLNQYLGKLAFLDDFSPNGLRREGGSSDDVVVDSSGNVGVGTSSPGATLEVAGSARLFGGSGTDGLLTIGSTGTSNDAVIIKYDNANDRLQFYNWGASASNQNTFVIDNANSRVGIGTTSPADELHINASSANVNLRLTRDTDTGVRITGTDSTSPAFIIETISSGTATERARIDSSGRLLLGTSASIGYDNNLQLVGSTADASAATFWRSSSDQGNPSINFVKTRGSVASPSIVSSGDGLGHIRFNGHDGTDHNSGAAEIRCYVDGIPGADDMPGRLVFSTTADGASTPTERLRINSVGQTMVNSAGTAAAPVISKVDDTNTGIFFPAANTIAFAEGGAEAARIDSNGRFLVGTSSSRGGFFNNTSGVDHNFQIEGTLSASFVRNEATGNGAFLTFGKTRGSSAGATTAVVSGDELGSISFQGADGSKLTEAVRISVAVDGTPGANDMPGRLVFSTTADGASSSTERMRIDRSGNVGINNTNPQYTLEVTGSFAATTKSFIIDHPTKEGMKLRYGSLEGPENGVYVRGKTTEFVIELPDYWTGLVDEDTITVNLTPFGKTQTLWVKEIKDNKVFVGSKCATVEYFYTVFGERKDVEKLEVEF